MPLYLPFTGVIPDVHFHAMVKSVFGKYSHVTRKLQRMMYWLPKFKYANPWPIPRVLPDDRIELAKMALRRMAFDVNNELSVWKVRYYSTFKPENFLTPCTHRSILY